MRPYERYVAVGDSTTEGLDDPDGAGGYRGWANRLAERIAAHQGSLAYANLGIRGHGARAIKQGRLRGARARSRSRDGGRRDERSAAASLRCARHRR